MQTAAVWPYAISPVHEVRDAEKLARLTDAMRRGGWQGRPLLVIAAGDGWKALTGSHRLAAARAVRLETVPCLCIENDDLTAEQWEEVDDLGVLARHHDDYDRVRVLREYELEEAAALMAAEVEANAAE